MSDRIQDMLHQESQSLSLVNQSLPIWTNQGLTDYSFAIHSAGVTYWTLLGRDLGFQAISEMPAPSAGTYAHVGDDVRSDSAWFPLDETLPTVLVEFERYGGPADAAKLEGKVANLLLAHHRWSGSATLLVLAYWTKSLRNLPDHRALKQRVKTGFGTTAKEKVSGSSKCELMIFQTVLQETAEGKWKLWKMIERGKE